MRSAQTRTKILDATLACLIELGYSGTSTPEVCRRAGTSRGAMLHHFPTKTELVVSAIQHLAERRALQLRAQTARIERAHGELERLFELVWAAFEGDLFHAALELWVAARSDPQLHAALFPMERSLGRGLRGFWHALHGAHAPADDATRERLDDLLALTTHLLRGMALQRILKDDDSERRRLFEQWKALAIGALRAPQAAEAEPGQRN